MGIRCRVRIRWSWNTKHVSPSTGKQPKRYIKDRRTNGDDFLCHENRLSLRRASSRLSVRANVWRISHGLRSACAGGASCSERWLESREKGWACLTTGVTEHTY